VAHSLSAKKRVRQNLRARARNRARKDSIKMQVKRFLTVLAGETQKKAQEELRKTTQRLDKVAAKGTIHKEHRLAQAQPARTAA